MNGSGNENFSMGTCELAGKAYIRDVLERMSAYEGCGSSNSRACQMIHSLNGNLNGMDLRFNEDKRQLFDGINDLGSQECRYCNAAGGIALDLVDKWGRNLANMRESGKITNCRSI